MPTIGRHVRRTTAVTAIWALAALSLTGCGEESTAQESQGVTVQHAQGKTTVPLDPQTVVTLDHAVLDSLDALNVPVTGVVKNGLPAFLDKYSAKEYEPVGALKEPDLEAIAAIDPDVIFISGRSAGFYDDLADIAPTVDMTATEGDFMAGLTETNSILGQIFDKQDEVKDRLDAVQARLDKVAALNDSNPTALITLISGGKASAFGAGSRFGAIHDSLGFTEAAKGLKRDSHGQAVSFEFFKETDPEWLFVIDRDAAIGEEGQAAKQVLDNALVNSTKAVRDGNVIYLDGRRWYVLNGGLNNAIEMIKPIQDALGR